MSSSFSFIFNLLVTEEHVDNKRGGCFLKFEGTWKLDSTVAVRTY